MGNIVEASVCCHMTGSSSHRPPGNCKQVSLHFECKNCEAIENEFLHFECKNCNDCWMIEKSKERTTYYCPWCGVQQSFVIPKLGD